MPRLSLPYSTNEENTKKEIIFGLETFFSVNGRVGNEEAEEVSQSV